VNPTTVFSVTGSIEYNKRIPNHEELFSVANHICALVDLVDEGNFAVAQGMKEEYICNDIYTPTVFNPIILLRSSDNWSAIYNFMLKEFGDEWAGWTETVIDDSRTPTA